MDGTTNKLIENIVSKLKRVYAPERIILFGSRAKNNALKDSDIDIIIVSEKFKDMDWCSRIADVIEKCKNIEPLCYTPEEFNRKKNELCIVKEAVEQGIELINTSS